MPAGMIMVFSENGKVARLLAKYRPCAPVLVVTSKREIARYCSALFGMYPLLLDKPISDSDQMPAAVTKALEFGVETGLCVAGESEEAGKKPIAQVWVCCSLPVMRLCFPSALPQNRAAIATSAAVMRPRPAHILFFVPKHRLVCSQLHFT